MIVPKSLQDLTGMLCDRAEDPKLPSASCTIAERPMSEVRALMYTLGNAVPSHQLMEEYGGAAVLTLKFRPRRLICEWMHKAGPSGIWQPQSTFQIPSDQNSLTQVAQQFGLL